MQFLFWDRKSGRLTKLVGCADKATAKAQAAPREAFAEAPAGVGLTTHRRDLAGRRFVPAEPDA